MADEPKIIEFRPEAEFPVTKRRKAHCKCSEVGEMFPEVRGLKVWIDEATRDCECRRCGARLDAFDYLWLVATEGDSLTRDLARLREDVSAAKAQVTLLEDEIKTLKAERQRLKRENQKERTD